MSVVVDLHALTLGDLPISGPASEWIDAAGGYEIRALAADASFGNPEPITVEIPSGIQDGSVERIDRWENREVTLRVEVRATDARGLAQGEADLAHACQTARTLTWLPPAAFGVETVFDLLWARIEWTFDDLDETPGGGGVVVRTFAVRAAAMPFPRASAEVVVPAVGGGTGTSTVIPVVTVLNDATSLTGWSAQVISPTVSNLGVTGGGSAGVSNGNLAPKAPSVSVLKYTGSWSMSTNRWLRVRYKQTGGYGGAQVAPKAWIFRTGTSNVLDPIAVIGDYAYYLLPTTGITTTAVWLIIPPQSTLTVYEVARVNTMPYTSTSRQLTRQFEVQGTARTQGSLALSHATMPLGQVLVYTWADDGSGYVPAIGDKLASGTTYAVTDANAATGRYLLLSTGSALSAYYDVPASTLPEGTYSIMVRAKRPVSGVATVAAVATTRINGVAVGEQGDRATLDWATTYRVQSVGQLTLPPVAVPRGSAATVRVTISLPNAADLLHLDEIYLCNVDTGDLTLLDAGSATPSAGGSSKLVWIDSPTSETLRPTIWVGTLADRSDARHISGLACNGDQVHQWPPGRVNVLTVSNAYDLAAELRYFPRFQHNAMAPEGVAA